ncbi:hypothetical protein B296_00022624, partial [Ensete ventricosum]
SYEHSFTKKYDVYKLYAKVKFQSVFLAHSRKFKILAIPNVLAHGKSYEYEFMKKCDDHKLFAKSSVNRFFRLSSPKFKILAIPNALALRKLYKHGFVKKVTVIIFAKSHAQSRVSISFSCTISEIQNTGHSQRICQWEVVRARFLEKT